MNLDETSWRKDDLVLGQSHLHVRTNRDGVVGRRSFMRTLALGAAGATLPGWRDAMTLQAAELRKRGMACILLFMRGAPSQFETFDPKPGVDNGGPTKAIDTAVGGIRIAEGWDNVAAGMNDISLIRSLTNKEGNHDRAVFQLHTGYVQSQTVKHPSIGAITAGELGPDGFDLPDFVTIGHRAGIIGSGFLGMSVAPFAVLDPTKTPNNVQLPPGTDAERFTRRHELLQDLEFDFAQAGGKARVEDHQTSTTAPSGWSSLRGSRRSIWLWRTILCATATAATTLVRAACWLGGWSRRGSHSSRSNRLAGTHTKTTSAVSRRWPVVSIRRFATLVADLKERGLLETTLVIWMGEFGRTPRINAKTGRDHHPSSSMPRWPAAASKAAGSLAPQRPMGHSSKNAPSQFQIYSAPSATP